jgi:hypothetical protein
MEDVQDLFISHAGSDKRVYIAPLAKSLSQRGLTFWLDDMEISWGDSVSMKINAGLRTSRFALLCLSRNFLGRPWPEAEMGAALAVQNENGIKRVLPLILNSKEEVLTQYPLLAGLAYREFEVGPSAIAEELAKLAQRPRDTEGKLHIVVESDYTGQIINILADPRVSIRWLRDKAQAGMGVLEAADTGSYVSFRVRWVLVDTQAEEVWLGLPRSRKRKLHAIVVNSDGKLKLSQHDRDRLQDLGVKSGTVFHIYAIEDEDYPPPNAAFI